MKKSNKLYDIVVLGPSHVELCGQQQGSALKNMLSFEKNIGHGAPKIAVGLARLGAKAALISDLGEDAMGQFILDSLLDENVDTSQVRTLPETITPLVIKNTDANAAQMITYCNLPKETSVSLPESFLEKSRALLIVNEWPAISDIKQAKANQVKIILLLGNQQINHLNNDHLALLALCDVVIGSELDYVNLFPAENVDAALALLAEQTNALRVVKHEQACYVPLLCHHNGFNTEHIKINIDACAMGFIAAWLQEKTLELCCEHANACETLMGLNTESPSLDALTFFLNHQNQVVARSIQSAFFTNLCYSSVQKRLKKPLFLLNLGDQKLWHKMAEPYGAKEDTIALAKQYMKVAIDCVFEDFPLAGLVFEDETTFSQKNWSTTLAWLARSLEKPGEIPLQFNTESELTSILSHWPKHHVAKVSVIYHPDDRYSLRGQQEALLSQCHKVCRDTQHALLIDLLMPMNSLITAKTHAHIIQRFYELGIYPDYWQMSIPRDQRSWENIYAIIQESAPFCQGLFINAIFASQEQLPTLIEIAGKEKMCQGLVVGRALFQNTVEQWFAKKIDDQTLVQNFSDSLRQIATLWYEKCQSGSFIDHLMPRSWQIYS
jgi:5-dehydro-2-deoxygluconokinase